MIRRLACALRLLVLPALCACHDGADHHAASTDAEVVSAPELPEAGASDETDLDASQASDTGAVDTENKDSSDAVDAAITHATFETAQPIEVGTTLLTDELAADQVDYYVFRGTAGSFYEIKTDDTSFSPDNVLALYDAQHALIAANDDGPLWPGDGIDARLVVRLPSDGMYYVRVEDLNTEADFFKQGFRLLYYHLSVREVSAQTPGFGNASGAGVAFAQDAKRSYSFVTVIDRLDAEQKSVAFTGLADSALIARIHPGGAKASGSSLEDGQLVVTAADGHRLASIDRAQDQHDFRPPVSVGNHQIALSSKSAHGENPFFVIDLVLLPDNPKEQNDTSNNSLAGAEAVTLSSGTVGRGLLLSRLPAGDVDYYRLPAQAGQQIAFNCEGQNTGSGVRGLRAELRDDADHVVGTMEEDAPDFRYTTERAGSFFLRLSGATPPADASAVEPWVRCVFFVS